MVKRKKLNKGAGNGLKSYSYRKVIEKCVSIGINLVNILMKQFLAEFRHFIRFF